MGLILDVFVYNICSSMMMIHNSVLFTHDAPRSCKKLRTSSVCDASPINKCVQRIVVVVYA